MTKLGQIVLDVICQAYAADADTYYGVGDCFNGMTLTSLHRDFRAAGIKLPQLGGIVNGLVEAGALSIEGQRDDINDVWVTPAGWLSWSGWRDEYLKDAYGDDGEKWQDWDLDDPDIKRRWEAVMSR